MIRFANKTVYLACGQTDMRKSINGLAAVVEGSFDGFFGAIDRGACGFTFFWRQLGHAFEQFGNLAALAKESSLDLLECVGVVSRGKGD